MTEATQTPGRNEPCPCGSGKKYKSCCAQAAPPAGSKWNTPYVLLFIAAIIAIAAYARFTGRTSDKSASATKAAESAAATTANLPALQPPPVDPSAMATQPLATPITMSQPAAIPGTLTPQPPGPVPEGKVWSPEHGHWHDVPGASSTTTITPQITPLDASGAATASPFPATPQPQPPGPAPEGKVWSPEHGHWHDAPGASTTTITPQIMPMDGSSSAPTITPMPATPGPQPPGPAPEGKVWSEEHGHWHDIAPQGTNPPPHGP